MSDSGLKSPIHLFLFHKKKRKKFYTLQENGRELQPRDYCSQLSFCLKTAWLHKEVLKAFLSQIWYVRSLALTLNVSSTSLWLFLKSFIIICAVNFMKDNWTSLGWWLACTCHITWIWLLPDSYRDKRHILSTGFLVPGIIGLKLWYAYTYLV